MSPRDLVLGPAVLPREFWLAASLLLGLCAGSFVNVLVHRLPRGMSIVRPRSSCPSCRSPIAWFDNVPLLSYLVLRGRCRRCGAWIPVRYPIGELATALLFVLVAARFGPTWRAVVAWAFTGALVAVTFIDLEHRIIPDEITLGGAVAGLILAPVTGRGVVCAGAGALLGGGLLYLLALLYERARGVQGMGGGDVKFAAMLGAFLGARGVLMTLFLASFVGTMAGIAVILARGGGGKTALPFGTFLAPSAFVVLLWEGAIVAAYLRLLS
jgi:leader peptidase (prepilin peptidase)/N-methyltransferase